MGGEVSEGGRGGGEEEVSGEGREGGLEGGREGGRERSSGERPGSRTSEYAAEHEVRQERLKVDGGGRGSGGGRVRVFSRRSSVPSLGPPLWPPA